MAHASDSLTRAVLLASQQKTAGLALADIVRRVIRDPAVFSYSELLDLPIVHQLGATEFASILRLLQLFSYGTLAEYKASQSQYPALDEPEVRKLRILTLASLAQRRKVIPYAELCDCLDITDIDELEALIIQTIYADLIQGTLDQRARLLEVSHASGRDFKMEDLGLLADKLEQWSASTSEALDAIGRQLLAIHSAQKGEADAKKAFEAKAAAAQKSLGGQGGGQDGSGSAFPSVRAMYAGLGASGAGSDFDGEGGSTSSGGAGGRGESKPGKRRQIARQGLPMGR